MTKDSNELDMLGQVNEVLANYGKQNIELGQQFYDFNVTYDKSVELFEEMKMLAYDSLWQVIKVLNPDVVVDARYLEIKNQLGYLKAVPEPIRTNLIRAGNKLMMVS